MKPVEDKKALHVRASIKAITKGKIVAAELQSSLGEIVSRSLKLYYNLHLLAKAEGRDTHEYILSLVKPLNQKYKEKKHGEKTGEGN